MCFRGSPGREGVWDGGWQRQHREEEEDEEGCPHGSSLKPSQPGAGTPSSPVGAESWDALFNDDGDCLDPRLLEEVRVWGWLCPWGASCWDVGMECAGCRCPHDY